MNRNVIETVLGAVVLVVAAIFVIFALGSANVGAKEGYIVSADFSRIDGLKPGSDVRVNGVLVGSVVDIALSEKNNYRATVRFTVQRDIKLPRDTNASVASESLLGGKYLSLDLGIEEDDLVPTNGKGRLTRVTPPMRLDDLIGQLIYKEDGAKKDAGSLNVPPPPGAAFVPPGPPPRDLPAQPGDME